MQENESCWCRGEWGNAEHGVIPDKAIVANRERITLLHYPIVLATSKCASVKLPPEQLVSSIKKKKKIKFWNFWEHPFIWDYAFNGRQFFETRNLNMAQWPLLNATHHTAKQTVLWSQKTQLLFITLKNS